DGAAGRILAGNNQTIANVTLATSPCSAHTNAVVSWGTSDETSVTGSDCGGSRPRARDRWDVALCRLVRNSRAPPARRHILDKRQDGRCAPVPIDAAGAARSAGRERGQLRLARDQS